jgi:signal transduction histidine kinase/DNA-binding response OmpR family regulator
MFDLTKLRLIDISKLGKQIRKIGDKGTCLEEVAQKTTDFLYNQLVYGEPQIKATSLVRLFKTHSFDQLEKSQREFAKNLLDKDQDTQKLKCLTLIASTGEHPDWNSREKSIGHQAIPLPNPDIVEQFPMIINLVRQLGVEVSNILTPSHEILLNDLEKTYGVFYVPQAVGSPMIPAQDEFVIPHNIESVLGFGGLFPSGDMFSMILFSKTQITEDIAELFKLLALYVRIAIFPYDKIVFHSDNKMAEEKRSLKEENLILWHESKTLKTLIEVQEQLTEETTIKLEDDVKKRKEIEKEKQRTLLQLQQINEIQLNFFQSGSKNKTFNKLLQTFLESTESEYGFIGEVLQNPEGKSYLKTHAITNIAWNEETQSFYEQNVELGLEFHNLDTLFGQVITSEERVLTNNPAEHPAAAGIPHGHPPLKAFLGVPLKLGLQLVGMVGIANRPQGYNEDLYRFIQPMVVSASNLIQVMRDIAERKRAEKNILKARAEAEAANLAKTTFLANMSHEIRTPMNAILGYSQILLRRIDLDFELRQALQTIDNSGKNLLDMINEILDISKIEAGKMELQKVNFDLKELLEGIYRLFEARCRQKRLSWKAERIKEPQIIFGDELKLRAILTNLIGNAVKFTDSGEIELKVTPQDEMQYLFEVKDTGKGISPQDQEQIFEPFHQEASGAKIGGTGLGLAISSKQLRLMGSELKVESELGKGSRFYFVLTLPEGTGEIEKRDDRTQNALYLTEECHVKALVVDDVKANRDVLSTSLSQLKVEVRQAESGGECLEMTREYLPDIIFMDMRMPGMSGEEAIKEIRKEFRDDQIKIAVITASAFDPKKRDYAKMGAQYFISKPFRVEQIVSCLDDLLKISFIYKNEDSLERESTNPVELDYSQVSLPEDLYRQLKEAAELYNITNLEIAIKKLQGMDENSCQLAIQLSECLKRYDMDRILEIISHLKCEKR